MMDERTSFRLLFQRGPYHTPQIEPEDFDFTTNNCEKEQLIPTFESGEEIMVNF